VSIKILDVSSLTICDSGLSDRASLRHQFTDKTCGNNEELNKAYALLGSVPDCQIIFKMVLVETEPLLGSSPQEIISSACTAIKIPPENLTQPSLGQIGHLASLFDEEEGVQRAIPVIVNDEEMFCILWKRANWPSPKQPVFRCHGRDPIHGNVWMMLPFPQ